MLLIRAARFRSFDAAGIVLMTSLLVYSTVLLVGTFATVFLRAYPFEDSDRLVMIWESDRETGVERLPVTEHAFPVYQQRLTAFEALAHFFPPRPQLPATLAATSEGVFIAGASPGLFPVLGVSAAHGRTFADEEGVIGAEPVAVMSHAFWQRSFGGDAAVINRRVDVHWLGQRQAFRVVGIMPSGFAFPHPLYPDEPDLWVAIQQVGGTRFLPGHNFYVIGRVKEGLPLDAIQAELSTVADQIGQEHPPVYGSISATAVPLRAESLREVAGVGMLFAAAFLMVVGIGLANLLHLVLIRTRSRAIEFATYLALGASRGTLGRLLAADVAVLALVGAAVGTLLAMWGAPVMLGLLPERLYVPSTTQPFAPRILLATAMGAVVGVVVLGVAVGLRVLSGDAVSTALLQRFGGGVGGPKAMKRAGDVALLWQVGTACALVTVTLGLVQHAKTILAQGSNLTPGTLLSMDIRFDNDTEDLAVAGLDHLLSTSQVDVSVREIALLDRYPYSGALSQVEIDRPFPGRAVAAATVHVTTRGLLQVFGLTVVDGRWFDSTDGPGRTPVAVVNESFARHYLADGDGRILGRRLATNLGSDRDGLEVIGVVRDPARFGTQADVPGIYVPWEQIRMRNVTLVARTRGEARRAAAPLRDRVLAIAPARVQVQQIRTGQDVLTEKAAPIRLLSAQLWWVSAVALLLAYGGICSITLFRTASRTKEFALRRAIGSTGRGLLLLILKEMSVTLLLGLGLGWGAAFLLARGLTALDAQFGVIRILPFVEAGAALLLIGLIAAIPPIIRATSVDPAQALRT